MASSNTDREIANVSYEEYRQIFGDSEDENESDIDFEGFSNVGSGDEESCDEESDDYESEEEEAGQQWSQTLTNINVNEFAGESGLLKNFSENAKADEYFLKVFGNESLDVIVAETNRFARQSLANKPTRLSQWKDTTKEEVKAYFGMCIIMGINVLPKVADYWSNDAFIGNDALKKIMPRNRFQELSQFLHFANSHLTPPRGAENYDRLYKVRSILSAVLKNSQEAYYPGKNLAVDEGMIAFKGRLEFRQYMPAKPTKYGIKVWMLADSSNGYVLNYDVYLGSDGKKRIHGLGYDAVASMVKPYMNKNHHVYFDNFFSSPILLEHLHMQQTYACSTVRCNRKGMPECAKKKLTQAGELVQAQKGDLLFTKWHDKHDVAFLSSNVSPEEASRTVKRTVKGQQVEIVKPRVSDKYTANMGGVDRADQLRSFYYAGRQTRKWYKYLFWFAFNLATVNSFILEAIDKKKKRP